MLHTRHFLSPTHTHTNTLSTLTYKQISETFDIGISHLVVMLHKGSRYVFGGHERHNESEKGTGFVSQWKRRFW